MRILRWAAHIFRSFDCGRVALPTLDHISSGPPKIPYVRFYRGREQACACPPAQIPACALTHGAPTSDDDERPLVRPRALKPVAVTRETPTQGRHRKCVLHYLSRQCRVVVSTDRLGVDLHRPSNQTIFTSIFDKTYLDQYVEEISEAICESPYGCEFRLG